MQTIYELSLMIIAVSVSGVITPGPLFAANVVHSLNGNFKTGLKVAAGHASVEFPLILAIGFGTLSLEKFPEYRIIIATVGALGLFAFAGLQIKQQIIHSEIKMQKKYGPVLAGIIFTAFNPFFLVWWLTVGLTLINKSIELFGILGIIALFFIHIWMDFAWLGAVSLFSTKIKNVITGKYFKGLVVILSVIMIYFGIMFLLEVL